ncbi:lipase [Cryptococcus deuterogattii LA55]|nr:lipase [Cryptococcus deuterogattii LA55]KIR90764.1 lipase [Cryptococcus deuterogattii CBS 10090]
MYIPGALRLSSYVLPFLSSPYPPTQSSPETSTISFKPVHAHGHAFVHNASTPTLFLHDHSPSTSLYAHDYPIGTFGDERVISLESDTLEIRTRKQLIRRPKVRPPRITSWAQSYRAQALNAKGINTSLPEYWLAPDLTNPSDEWSDVEVTVPDLTDRQTVLALAKMTSNAYVTPGGAGWYPLEGWNASTPFGWEPEADGLRGHVFADEKNETIIISIKGTSAGVLGSGGPTAKNDKFNDNLLFSCCCARVDFSWTPVCDCYAGGYKCGQTCLEDSLISESVYATVGTNLYNNITYMYPNATIWLTGHSLGGAISSLIGLSFGAPAVTYESPGELLPASRLHLPLPPGMPANMTGITHVYHTADPIAMGVCNGAYSACYAAGFAMESKCHTGETILYDTVKVKRWSVDLRTHRIEDVIDRVLADPWPVDDEDGDGDGDEGGSVIWQKIAKGWYKCANRVWPEQNQSVSSHHDDDDVEAWWGWGRRGRKKEREEKDDPEWEKHGGVPKAISEEDCVDCYKWEFGEWDK